MNILQKAIRSMYSLTGSFNDKLLKYFKQYGATSSVLQDAEKQYLVGRLGAKYLTNQDYWKELDAQFGDGLPLEVSDILRKYGNDAHLYTFGPGVPILGPELVVNGSFDSDTVWTKHANTTISGGVASTTGIAAFGTMLSQTLPFVAGKAYKYSITATKVSGSNISLSCGAQTIASGIGVTGTASGYFTATVGGSIPFYVWENSGGTWVGSVDNISIQEVLGYSNTYSGFVAGNYFDSAGTTHASVDGSVGLVLDAAGGLGPDLCAATTIASAQTIILLSVGPYAGRSFEVKNAPAGLSWHDGTGVYGLGALARQVIKLNYGASGLNLYQATGSALDISAVEVREVTGIHAIQSTPGYKPTLRKGIVNLLTWSNDITNGVWFVSGSAAKTSGSSATFTTSVSDTLYQANTVVAGAPYTMAALLSGDAGKQIKIMNEDNGGPYNGAQQIITLSETPTLHVVSYASSLTSMVSMIRSVGQACTVTIGGVGLFAGTLTAADILAAGGIPLTTTAPASSQAGVNYLEIGNDDGLAVPIDLTGSEFTMVVAFKPLGFPNGDFSPAIMGTGQSPNTNPHIGITATGGVRFGQYGNDVNSEAGLAPVGKWAVISAVRSLTGRRLYLNSALVASDSNTVMLASSPGLALGSLHFAVKATGLLAGAAIVKAALSDADLRLLEKQVSAGIQL